MTPDQEKLFLSLSGCEQDFVTSLMAGKAPKDAARDASKNGKSDGYFRKYACELLQREGVKAFLDSVKLSMAEAAIMTQQEALERLSAIGRTSINDLVEWGEYVVCKDDKGNEIKQSVWRVKDSAMQDPVAMACISELSSGKDGIKIKMYNSLQAQKQLAEMQGWEAPKRIKTFEAKSLNDFYSDEADEEADP